MLNIPAARHRNPERWIENRASFTSGDAELSIYDTYVAASQVALHAEELLFCGMISGRKLMHAAADPAAEFLPGQSFVMSPGQVVHIDFPDATRDVPTTCLALHLTRERIGREAERLNRLVPREADLPAWDYVPQVLHTTHGPATQQLLERLTQLFTEAHPERDVLVDLGLSELVVRLLREQTRSILLLDSERGSPRHGLTAALGWLRRNLDAPLDPVRLAREACMSRSQLYRLFSQELGCTPGELQRRLRLEAARHLLARGEIGVTEVCYRLGFQSPSHFSRAFRAYTGQSPSAYRTEPLL